MKKLSEVLKQETWFHLILKILSCLSKKICSFYFRFCFKSCGGGLAVLSGVRISGSQNIKFGKNCFIGRNVILDSSEGFLEIGDNVEIRDNVRIYARNIQIGNGATIAEGAFLNGEIKIALEAWVARGCDLSGKVNIDKAILGPYVKCIGSAGHQRDTKDQSILMSSKKVPPETKVNFSDPTIIVSDGVWIGTSSIILKGVIVAKNSVVGAGSVVTKNTEENCVVAGNPAREINSKLKVDI